jgi:hypothetical protein
MMHSEYIAAVLDEIIELSVKIGIPLADGFCPVGKFMVEVSSDKQSFSFWEEGRREEKITTISGHARILSILTLGRMMTINVVDQNFPSIEELVWGDCDYPRCGFVWIGWDKTENIKKGMLSYVRVELYEKLHLAYQKKTAGEGYLVINPTGIRLLSYKLPKKLEKVRKISGVSFSHRIEFDAKIKRIICISNIEDFLEELRLSAESK